MDLLEIIRLSFSNLKSFKFRSFLTMLGIIMGIGSVILISSIGAGFEQNILSDINKNTKAGVTITVADKYRKIKKSKSDLFSENELELISRLPFVNKVAPREIFNGLVGEQLIYMSGETNKTFSIGASELSSGRLFLPEEMNSSSNVLLIDRLSAQTLFPNQNPVGKTIKLNSFENEFIGEYTIIGTYKSIDENISKLFPYGIQAMVPLAHVDALTGNNSKLYSDVLVVFKNEKTLKTDIEKLKNYLKTKNTQHPDFYDIKPVSDQIGQVSSILGKITLMISLIAAISLIVGGIGVMNIMLVSVNERITEIGLRKAIGAKNKDILLQFLIESMILTVIGGIIGVTFGFLLANLIGFVVNIKPVLEFKALMTSVVLSSSIGLIFGIYPARQASKLSPMEALRKE